MILNTGSRTDIPAFYSDWFMKRIREGFVMVRNPYYPKLVTRYAIEPATTDVIVFCTKNPEPMLKHLEELKTFRMYWNVTITPYGKEIEENVPAKREVMDSLIRLSDAIGKEKIAWRYDPIFLSARYTREYHLMIFEKMCAYLNGCCETVIISFIDLYEKTKRNFPEAQEVSKEDQCFLTEWFVKIASRYGMSIKTCHENESLARYGADVSGCLSTQTLEKAIGETLQPGTINYARQGCKCLLGNDIGAYNTCLHFCRYCYANYDKQLVLQNAKQHDPDSPLLIGNIEEGDEIREYQARSYIDRQLKLF